MTPSPTQISRVAAPRRLLLRRYRPELDRLVATAKSLGLASPLWKGPSEFRLRRDKGYGAGGRAHCWGIYITIGQRCREGRILQVIAHELAHLLPWNPSDKHGRVFRETLRALVKANWPGIPAWVEGDRYDDESDCYAEGDRIEDAIDAWLAKAGAK